MTKQYLHCYHVGMTLEILVTVFTHTVVFIAGVLFDRFVLKHIVEDGRKVDFSVGEIIRVAVLLTIFVIYSAALIQAQFYSGTAPTTPLTLIGIFSFGSLVGERDFFAKLLSSFFKK